MEAKTTHTPGPWWHIGARVYAVSLNQLDDVDEPLNIAVADCDMDMRIDHDTTATANAALIAAAPELLEALTKCRDVFMRYAELHAAKGTPEGAEKAKANHDLATMCEAAISRATQTEGESR